MDLENKESLKSEKEKEFFKELAKQIDLSRVYKDDNDKYLYMIDAINVEGSSVTYFIMINQYGTVKTYLDYQVEPAEINPIPKFLSLLSKGIK